MPHYFFHIRNGNGVTADEEGRDFVDADAAREEAVRGIRSILSEEALYGRLDLRGAIDVSVDGGEAAFSVPFREAFEILTGEPPEPGEPTRRATDGPQPH